MRSKTTRVLGYAGLFLFGFLFFMYVTFPYEVLKEALTNEIQRATGYTVTMDRLEPKFLIGLGAKDLRIESPRGDSAFELARADLRLGLLPLLLGRLGVEFQAEAKEGGRLSFKTSIGVFKLLLRKNLQMTDVLLDVISKMSLAAEKFAINSIMGFTFHSVAGLPTTSPMLTSLLENLRFNGKLTGKVELSIDPETPARSDGTIDLKLADAMLVLSSPSLGLPDQTFSKSMIQARLVNGALTFDNAPGFTAPDLDFAINGRITLRPGSEPSQLDLTLPIKLDKALKAQFGFIVDAMSGGSRGGSVTIQVRGPANAPTITPM